MINLMFMGQGILFDKCFNILLDYSKSIDLTSMVISNLCYRRFYYTIDNKNRNEGDILNCIKKFDVNIIISVQHPWILSKDIIDAVNGNVFNLHNAKLPEYKGHNTITHALLNRETEYCSTIHWVIPEVDSGDIAYTDKVFVDEQDTAWSLYNKTIPIVVSNFKKLLDGIVNDNIPRIPQQGLPHYYKKKAIEEYRQIQYFNDLEIARKSRAFWFPGKEPAYMVINSQKYYITPKDLYNNVQFS